MAQLGDSGQPNERAELDSGKYQLLERDVWYGFSFLIPAEFPIVDTRLVIAQWKQSDVEGSPLIAQRFVAGRHYVTIRDTKTKGGWRETFDLPPIVPNLWNDMVYHIRFSGETGIVEIWMNSEPVARFEGITAAPHGSDSFYNKVGLYRDRMAEPMTIYIDNYAVGGSMESVNPMHFPKQRP